MEGPGRGRGSGERENVDMFSGGSTHRAIIGALLGVGWRVGMNPRISSHAGEELPREGEDQGKGNGEQVWMGSIQCG